MNRKELGEKTDKGDEFWHMSPKEEGKSWRM